MNQSKRLKIAKRDKQSLIQLNYQKQLTLQQAFEHEKQKNHTLKQKNQKLQIKCKLLYQKLYRDKQKIDQVTNNLNQDIYELDNNIKQYQQQLYFRYSKQMYKLKKKIKNFLLLINFQIDQQDLQAINNQIDLILLLLDIFQVKYDQLTSQNIQTFQLLSKLRQPQSISGTAERIKALEQELENYHKQYIHLKDLTKDYQRQITYLKKNLQENKNNIQIINHNSQNPPTNKTIQKFKAKINQLQSQVNLKDLQLHKKNKMIHDLQTQLQNYTKKYKSIFDQFQKFKKDDTRWKQRYSIMENQKNQRIQLLQSQLNKRIGYSNAQDSIVGYSSR